MSATAALIMKTGDAALHAGIGAQNPEAANCALGMCTQATAQDLTNYMDMGTAMAKASQAANTDRVPKDRAPQSIVARLEQPAAQRPTGNAR